MASPIIPVVTLAGLAAALTAQLNSVQVEFTHIALGDGQWAPDDTATALMNELQRVPITAGQFIPPNQLHVSALVDGGTEYWVNEFAIIGDGSTVMAIYSDPVQPITFKASTVDILFNHDLIINAYPPASITVSNITTSLNLTLATEITQLATGIISINYREVLSLVTRLDHEARLAALEA